MTNLINQIKNDYQYANNIFDSEYDTGDNNDTVIYLKGKKKFIKNEFLKKYKSIIHNNHIVISSYSGHYTFISSEDLMCFTFYTNGILIYGNRFGLYKHPIIDTIDDITEEYLLLNKLNGNLDD